MKLLSTWNRALSMIWLLSSARRHQLGNNAISVFPIFSRNGLEETLGMELNIPGIAT